MTTVELPGYIGMTKVACRLGVSRARVYQLLAHGHLRTLRVGQFQVASIADVEALKEKRARAAGIIPPLDSEASSER